MARRTVASLRGVLALGLGVFAGGVCAAADELPPPVLGGPEVVKLDWGIRRILPADVNGDDRIDLIAINNDRARLDLLLQRAPGAALARPAERRVSSNRWEPELEDSRFEKVPLTTGIAMFDVAAGDLNGDGRVDIAYTGDPDAVTVRYQSSTGGWDDKHVFDLGDPSKYLTVILIQDLDGDRRADLLVVLQKDLVVLRQNEKGELGAPERYALSEDSCFSLDLADLNGDGRKDVLYLASGRRDGLRVRLQQPGGGLGPEIPFRIEMSRTTFQLVDRPGRSPGLAYIQNQTAMLGVVGLAEGLDTGGAFESLKPRVYSTQLGAKIAPAYAFGDVDGDGRLDLAVSDGDGARILVYFQNATGELGEGQAYPSLSDGRALAAADWDGDGKVELFVTSPKEQTLGVAHYTAAGRLSYPQPLTLGSGRPLLVDAGLPDGERSPLVAVALEEGGKRRIDFLVPKDGGAETRQSLVLEGLRTDPRAIRFVDANQDGRLDLAVFVPFEAMRLLVQGEDGTFADVSRESGYRKGLVENLDPSALTLADVDGDGRREMLVSGDGFARALRLDETGTLQVADQFNAREAGTDISASFAADIDGDGQRDVVLFDRRSEQLQVLQRNEKGVYIYADAVPVSSIDLVDTVQLDFNRDGREDLFFLGKDRFWVVPIGARNFGVETLLTYETDLKDVSYTDVAYGDLNGDGRGDFVLLDQRQNLVEVLVRDGMDVKSVLHFRVFESDPHAQRRGNQTAEPREAIIADVTGDGRQDLVLLVHDRVLVYPQE